MGKEAPPETTQGKGKSTFLARWSVPKEAKKSKIEWVVCVRWDATMQPYT
jgi:hypothetical protein